MTGTHEILSEFSSTAAPPAPSITLLDLVSELSATGAHDREVVAAVMDLLETRRVTLVGQVCDEDFPAHRRQPAELPEELA